MEKINKENTLFVLGANDPEMDTIIDILEVVNYKFILATVNENICNPTNAYLADNDLSKFKYKNIVFIECNHIKDIKTKYNLYYIDHHKKGDYGYNLDYKNFLSASSIGQLFKFFIKRDKEAADLLSLSLMYKNNNKEDYYFENGQWLLNHNEFAIIIPNHIVSIAAIDHCLADAYKGLCKGVNTEDIHREQINAISKKYNISKKELNILYNEFSNIISNNTKNILDLTHLDLGIGYSLEYILLREIALFKNKSIALKIKNNFSEEEKLMLLCISKLEVENFLDKPYFNGYNLTNVFGVPTRGYAGGLIF